MRTISRNPLLAAWLMVLPALFAATYAGAAARAGLAPVPAQVDCSALARTELSGAVGAQSAVASTKVKPTGKGDYCVVEGTIAPAIRFEVDLPTTHWTQRFLQEGCGGLCGNVSTGVGNAATCLPALNGELVIAANNLGHDAKDGPFGADPQRRIDFAYRANHLVALAAKALIRAYYGQAPRYSYFMGCSDGGREALIEAQRFPNDFDGISAGDPAAMFQTQNSFYGAWTDAVNTRADRSHILLAGKAKLIHDAVLAACDTLSGVHDGVLQDPRSCRFDPKSLQCPATGGDSAQCLTGDEEEALQKLYQGPGDAQGQRFAFGAQPGGEVSTWHLPAEAAPGPHDGPGFTAESVEYLILPTVSHEDADLARFAFTQANFERMAQLAPLYNGLNTDLRGFAGHGGRLILWHGWSDVAVTPGVSIAYYQGVRKFMGAAQTDAVLRLFMIPGMGHCQGGDGYDQFDVLTPLMNWVEHRQAPSRLMSARRAPKPEADHGPGGMPKLVPGIRPLPEVATDLIARRPVYPYPMMARYTGQGDPNDPAHYRPVRTPVALPEAFTRNLALSLIGPDNQKDYAVQDGKLIALH